MGRRTLRVAVPLIATAVLLVAAPAAAANPVGDLWDWGTGLLGDAAGGVAADGIRALTSWVADGAGWLVTRCFDALAATSDPRPGTAWFDEAYRRMAVIAAVLAAPCLMLGLTQAILQQDGRMLGRVVLAVPGSVLLTLAAVAVTRTLLVATDQMSLWLIGASGRDLGEFGTKMAATLAASPGTSAFVVFLVSAFAAVCGLVLWIELLVRAALVYVLLAFFPVMAALMIWPSTAGGIRRLIRLLVAIVLSKVVIVGVVAMGVAAASSSGVDDRFEGLLVGVAMVAIACFAPMAIHRLLPVLEEAVQVRGSLSAGGGLRSAQTGHYSASAARDVVSQLRAARGAAPGAGTGGAGGAGTPAAAAGGRMPGFARAGTMGVAGGGGR